MPKLTPYTRIVASHDDSHYGSLLGTSTPPVLFGSVVWWETQRCLIVKELHGTSCDSFAWAFPCFFALDPWYFTWKATILSLFWLGEWSLTWQLPWILLLWYSLYDDVLFILITGCSKSWWCKCCSALLVWYHKNSQTPPRSGWGFEHGSCVWQPIQMWECCHCQLRTKKIQENQRNT